MPAIVHLRGHIRQQIFFLLSLAFAFPIERGLDLESGINLDMRL